MDECARPIVEHVGDPDPVDDAEGEIHVGEAVATVNGKRAHGGPGDDTLVLLRQLEHTPSESVPLRNGEQGGAIVIA
jgi:hypothetical protein